MNIRIYKCFLIVLAFLYMLVNPLCAEIEQEVFASVSLASDTGINPDPEFMEWIFDKSDARYSLNAEYKLSFELSPDDLAGLKVAGYMNSYLQENDFNNNGLSFTGFYQKDHMGPLTFYGNVSYGHIGLDRDAYGNMSGSSSSSDSLLYTFNINPTLFWKQSDILTGMVGISHRTINYYDSSFDVDSKDLGLHLKEIWQINSQQELSGGLYLNRVNSEDDAFSYSGMRLDIEYTFLISKHLDVGGVLSYGTKTYGDEWVTKKRKENYLHITVTMNYNILVNGTNFGRVFAGLVYYKNNSNVDNAFGSGSDYEGFDITRTTIQAGYIYTFTF